MRSAETRRPFDFSRRENRIALIILGTIALALLLLALLPLLFKPASLRIRRSRPARTGTIEYLMDVSYRDNKIMFLPRQVPTPEIYSFLALYQDGYLEKGVETLTRLLKNAEDPLVRLSACVNLANTLDDLGDHGRAKQYYLQALGMDRKNGYTHFNYGVALYHAGRTKESLEQFLASHKLKPDFDRAIINIGNILFETGEMQKAVDWYGRTPKKSPLYRQSRYNTAMALWKTDENANQKEIIRLLGALLDRRDTTAYLAALNLGNLYYARQDFSRARDYYLTASTINTQNYTAWYNLGLLEKETKNYERAIPYLQKASERRKNFHNVYRHMGEIYYGQSQPAAGIFQFEKLLAVTNDRTAQALLADLYYENGPETWADALDLYAELAGQGSIDERRIAYANSGNIYFGRTNYHRALLFYNEALKLSPGDSRLQANSGLALARIGKLDEALDAFLKVLAVEPENEHAQMNVIILHAARNRTARAVELCRDFISRRGDHPAFLHLLATLYLRTRDYPKASEALDRLETTDPALQIETALYRGFIAFKNGKYPEALAWYDRILGLQRDHPQALINKGIVLYHLARYDASSAELMKAVNLTDQPDLLAPAYLHMANVFFRQTDYPAALHLYQRALDLQPDSAEIHHNANLVRQRMR